MAEEVLHVSGAEEDGGMLLPKVEGEESRLMAVRHGEMLVPSEQEAERAAEPQDVAVDVFGGGADRVCVRSEPIDGG